MVTIILPATLQPFADGRRVVELVPPVPTVRAALSTLGEQYPGVHDRVLTERGELRQHVNVFVGVENIRTTGGLATAVRDGSELSIVPAVSGG